MRIRDVSRLVKDAGVKFWEDEGPRLGAALAFYIALSLSPLLLAAVAVAGLAFGKEAARGELVAEMRDTVGNDAATVIEQLVARSSETSHGVIAAVTAFLILLYGASRVFSELQSALNTIWNVPGRTTSGGWRGFLKRRLLSLTLVWGTAFLLVASLVVSAILSGVTDRVAGWLPGTALLAEILNFLLTLGLLTILFAMIFEWLPETDLAWSDVWLGAAITAALFSIGKYAIGLYLGTAAVGSAYGAAGAFVVLLVWLYYSAQLLLFGAELTFVYAQRFGSGVGAASPVP